MEILEQFVRRYAKRITRNGQPVMITDGDPLLLAAFKTLGWSDPCEETPVEEVAVAAEAPERAVLPHRSKR